MANKTRQKTHFDDAAVFDGLHILQFPAVTPGGAIINSTISGRMILPVSCKIFAVSIVQATGSHFVTSFNVIVGTGADATPSNPIGTNDTSDSFVVTGPGAVTGGQPPTLAAIGTALFAADQSVTLTGDQPQTFFNPNFDVIFAAPQSGATTQSLLTLRLVAAGSGGLCQVTLLIKPYDIKSYTPRTTSFSPANDIG